MAEVKNAFIKSKMNQDLDDRLIPPGEYREGINIQVSKSEGQDVGALENVIGNSPAVNTVGANIDFNALAGVPAGSAQLKSIGVYGDVNTGSIFVFLTNWVDTVSANETPIVWSADALNYIYEYNTLTKNVSKLAEGAWLNFAQNNPIYGINLIDTLLFWTDNRNQPRKLNVSRADNGTFYINEETVSVAKYNPYRAIDLYYDAPAPVNSYVTSMQDVTSEFLPDPTKNNPFYDATWPGDPDYLEDKFVSFSYRFKFIDGEYSIMAPFTQAAFIPKQDGYFLAGDEDSTYRSTIVEFMENKVNNVGLYVPLPSAANQLKSNFHVTDIELLYKESDGLSVKVLEAVSSVDFSLNEDGTENNSLNSYGQGFYKYNYQSRKPYKTLPESEIIRVFDRVPVKALGQEIISNRVVYSNFQDKHTPPDSIDYDVAVTAKGTFTQGNANQSLNNTSIVEYPMHTVKQNRNYQVGIVLSDRFGRQSTVILSPVKTTQITDTQGITYGGSTYYHPYKPTPVLPVGAPVNDIFSWPGDSLKLLVNGQIPVNADPTTSYPGVYNGDATSASYNPLGWYSYKIVVKQSEQEYYNVYLPGIMGFYPNIPTTPPDPNGTIAFITLLNDNINKVPRDLTEVGPNQKQYRSSVELYGRVTPDITTANPNQYSGNQPYYPTTATVSGAVITSISPPTSNVVSTISLQNDFVPQGTTIVEYGSIYQTLSNPSMARLTQSGNLIGSLQPAAVTTLVTTTLGVYETVPVESLLDIFWETSTSGLVSDFNSAVDSGPQVEGFSSFNFVQTEATTAGIAATSTPDFFPLLPAGLGSVAMESSSVTIVSVKDLSGNDKTGDWTLVAGEPDGNINTWRLNVVNSQYYTIAEATRRFVFTFSVLNTSSAAAAAGAVPADLTVTVGLQNMPPVIQNTPLAPITLSPTYGGGVITTYSGVNGSVGPPNPYTITTDLEWSITDQVPAPVAGLIPALVINSTNGELSEPEASAEGNYSFNVNLTDSGGATVTAPAIVVFGKEQINLGWGKRDGVTINEGMESSGMYWSNDYNNASLINVIEGNLPEGMRNVLSGRAAITGLSLSDTGLSTANLVNTVRDQEVEALTNCPYPNNEGYVDFVNTNRRPSAQLNDNNGQHALSEGTAYIKIDYTYKSFPLQNDGSSSRFGDLSLQPQVSGGVAWPSFLQYRASSSDNWVRAIDIEGQDITLGGVQRNSYNLSPTTGSTAVETGVICDASKVEGNLIANTPGEFPGVNIVDFNEVTTTFREFGNFDKPLLESVSSKVFAIGKDQNGYGTATKHGEYRLIIRYPANGYETTSREGTGADNVVPSPSVCVYNTQVKVRPNLINQKIKVNIDFGDFYYPNNTTDTVFTYLISNDSRTSSAEASGDTPTQQVFAREWSLKYVSFFYTTPQMTTIKTLTNGFYSYSSYNDDDINTTKGNQNSFIQATTNRLQNGTYPLTGGFDPHLRRWTAEFSSNKKVAGTSLPNTVELPFY